MYKMAVLSRIKLHSDGVDYFKELLFYNKPIKKSKVKRLKNIDRLIKGCAMSYKVEIIEEKYPIVQLEATKPSIKDLLNDLLNETKGFMYQITAYVLLKKYKHNGKIEFDPVYFNSFTKTVINHRFKLEIFFQEMLCMIDFGLIKDLAGMLNQLSLNALTFRLIDL